MLREHLAILDPGQARILVVDDVLRSGRTLEAAVRKVRALLRELTAQGKTASPAAASFSSCVGEAAVRAGVSRSVACRALDISQPDEKVLRLSEVQPEFKTPIWDYLGFLVDEQRVADGRAMMRQYDHILRPGERRSIAMSSPPFGASRPITGARRATATCPMRSPRSFARAAGARAPFGPAFAVQNRSALRAGTAQSTGQR